MGGGTHSTGRAWRNRLLVRERDPHLGRWLGIMLVAAVVAVAPGGAYLVQQNECVKVSYEVSRLRTEQEELLEQERRLRAERARLSSLPRIEAWARGKGGLVPQDSITSPPRAKRIEMMARTPAPAEVRAR